MTSKTKMVRFGEISFGLGIILMGMLVAFLTTNIPIGPAYSAVGPRIFPWLISGALVVIGALVIIENLMTAGPTERPEVDRQAIAWVAAGLAAQLILMEPAGFVIASTVLFVAVARAFGGYRLSVEVAAGLALCIAAYFGFTLGLGLNLPTGFLGNPW